MPKFEEWQALKPEKRREWNIAAPYGRSGVWYWEKSEGKMPGEEQRKKDYEGLGVPNKKRLHVNEEGIYVGVDRTGTTAKVVGKGRLKVHVKKGKGK